MVEGIKSVRCVCLSVRQSVIQPSHGWTVWHTDVKIGRDIDLDKILDNFEGQGHRSKVKVAILKNVIFRHFDGATCIDCTDPFYDDVWSHMTLRRDITAWRLDVLWPLLRKNTDKEGTSQEGASTLRRFHINYFYYLWEVLIRFVEKDVLIWFHVFTRSVFWVVLHYPGITLIRCFLIKRNNFPNKKMIGLAKHSATK